MNNRTKATNSVVFINMISSSMLLSFLIFSAALAVSTNASSLSNSASAAKRTFHPTDKLLEDESFAQITYANNGASESLPIVGWIENSKTAILISTTMSTSPQLSLSRSKKSECFQNFIVLTTGYNPDLRQFLNHANVCFEDHKFKFGSVPTIQKMCYLLSKWLIKGFFVVGNEESDDKVPTRPYSLVALLSTFDELERRVQLYVLKNSGVSYNCRFAAEGKLSTSSILSIRNKLSIHPGNIPTCDLSSNSINELDTILTDKIRYVMKYMAQDLDNSPIHREINDSLEYEIIVVRAGRVAQIVIPYSQIHDFNITTIC